MLDRFTSATPDQLLHIYLNDHRTGAVAAHQLAVRSRSANDGNEFGEFLDEFIPQLEDDIAQLDAVFEACGVAKNLPKFIAAYVAATLGQFKLNGRLTEYSPLSRVIEFEALTVGVTGKRKLWRTIAGLPLGHPATLVVDAPALAARTEFHSARLDELSERASMLAFAEADVAAAAR